MIIKDLPYYLGVLVPRGPAGGSPLSTPDMGGDSLTLERTTSLSPVPTKERPFTLLLQEQDETASFKMLSEAGDVAQMVESLPGTSKGLG